MENQKKKLRLDELKVESFVTTPMLHFDTETPKGGNGTSGDSEDVCTWGNLCDEEVTGHSNCGICDTVYPPIVVYPPHESSPLANCGGGGAKVTQVVDIVATCYFPYPQ